MLGGGRPAATDYAENDDYSLYDSLNQKSYASRLADEKVNLVQDSLPNFARIDHFAQENSKRSEELERRSNRQS
jgi:hypothetical protein